ncbi:MAG: low molecular weight phosphotyrosine protein phosphatase [Ferruginibacter sp.]|nr:low molecular weight phosphotyrosine protein phosphatase [Ferruginibacter sp.]
MVCLGNICRSPLAEGILQQKALEAGLNWEIQSAGTNRYHIGSAPHPLSQKVAQLNGIDISAQRARRIQHSDMDEFDIIYALATDVLGDIKEITGTTFRPDKVKLFMHEHPHASEVDVPDPWYGDESGYHEVYRLLDDVCNHIIQTYKSHAQ